MECIEDPEEPIEDEEFFDGEEESDDDFEDEEFDEDMEDDGDCKKSSCSKPKKVSLTSLEGLKKHFDDVLLEKMELMQL